MDNLIPAKEDKLRAGHQEILGETLAKFEFFQAGWHPYSRFLDVDKVDLLLRRRKKDSLPEYKEVQVKFGKLYTCRAQWERDLFSSTSWRFFSEKNLTDIEERGRLFLAYVLAADHGGFQGDMFIFRIADFVRMADRLGNGNYRLYISRSVADPSRWYVRRKWNFSTLDESSVVDVSRYYRDFTCLE